MPRKDHPAAADSPALGGGRSGFARDAGSDAEGRLVSARNVLAECFGASAEEPWSVDRWPVIRDGQGAVLEKWADDKCAWLRAEDLGSVERGGKEHDLLPEMETGKRFWKVTKGGGFGWYPFCEDLVGRPSDALTMRFGSPFQYLTRMVMMNELVEAPKPFIRLEGITKLDGRFAMVTSTKFVPGENATNTEIAGWMAERRFRPLSDDKWFREADGLGACRT